MEEIVAIKKTEVPVEKAPAVEEAPAEGAPVEVAPEEGISVKVAPEEVPVVETETELIERFKTKNEQGRLTQQEFFRIFLISAQNRLTINQRVSAVEKKL